MKIVSTPRRLQEYLNVFEPLFTKPSYESFCHMTTAIAICEKSRTVKNLHNTLANGGRKSRRAYEWFFKDAKWDEDRVAQHKAEAFFRAIKLKKGDMILLIIDDTHKNKKGKMTDGVGKFLDHSKGFIWGNNFVTSVLQHKELFIPHKARMYIKEEDAEVDERFEFRKKPEIAFEDMITPLKLPEGVRLMVVFDSWWFSVWLINSCLELGHDVTCRIKRDKLITTDGSTIQVQEYAKNLEKEDFKTIKILVRGKKKTYKVSEDFVELEGIGRVKLLVSRKSFKGKSKYYICTDLNLSASEILSIYENRWSIEICHREANQQLGFKDYQMRNKRGIERFIQLVFLMWTLILLIELKGRIDFELLEMSKLSEMLEGIRVEVFIDMFKSILGFFGIPLPEGGVITTLRKFGYRV